MNVYEKTMERISYLFNEFDRIVVSFSGGKDSGVLLNLAIDYATSHQSLHRLAVYHMDYEAQYQMTTEYVTRTFNSLPPEVSKYWICLPVKAQCCTSMYQSYWQPWKVDQKNIWCRDLPRHEGVISEDNFNLEFNYEVSDYEFNIDFGRAISKNVKTCFMVGIRSQESLNRYRTMNRSEEANLYKGLNYTTVITENLVNAYPLFDWRTEDVWIANGRFGYDYNKLYDVMYQAGVPLHAMRVASPFNDAAPASLKLYKTIEPHTWGKLISRVNGVNFTGIYGGTTAMGWKSITLPQEMTWESYMYFLLDTLPEEAKNRYKEKLAVSMKFWRERGGVLSEQTIQKLKDAGIKIEVSDSTNYKTTKLPVRMEYVDSIDISEFREIPTFKRMCICIMKNDHLCKYMGFSQTKDEMAKRKNIINKYQNLL